jgi:hypothetical protein
MAKVKYLHLNMLLISGNFVSQYYYRNIICRLFTLTFAGRVKSWCETLSPASIHTWEQFMRKFLHAFENYDYDNLCEEILELKKNEDESLKDFVIRFTHLCYRFPLDDRPSNNDLISCLVSLINETHKSMDEKSKSCFNLSSHVDLDLNENVENVNGLDGLHMSGSFFTVGDIDQIENYFFRKNICILPPLHSPFLSL